MAAIIISTVEAEVVLSFPNAKDLRMRGLTEGQISDLKNLIQLRYITKCPTKTLMIFGVPQKSLREFSHDNKKYGFINLPSDDYRLRDQEHTGVEEKEDERDDEAQMQDIFNQTIIQEEVGGRESLKGRPDEDELSFAVQSTDSLAVSTSASSDNLTETRNDMKRASTIKSRKPDNVNLEDFEIECQLGKGTFGKVYLASLPGSD